MKSKKQIQTKSFGLVRVRKSCRFSSRTKPSQKRYPQAKMRILILFFIIQSSTTFGQEKSIKKYISHRKIESVTRCYSVNEITIYPDSTYTFRGCCTSKKNWKDYTKIEMKIDSGRISKKGKYYILTEYKNGQKTDYPPRFIKINDRRILFYYKFSDRDNKLKRVNKFQRFE